jgi:prolipoprotein diacylglyceryltransferase
VKAYGNFYSVHVNSIKSIKREKNSHAGAGFFIGIIAGGILGNRIAHNLANDDGFFSDINNSLNVFFGTTIGMAVGGIIGFSTGKGLGADEYYDFSRRNHNEKKKLLSELINRSRK